MARKILTDPSIRAAIGRVRKTGEEVWMSDGYLPPRGYGSLLLNITARHTVNWYWRYTTSTGKLDPYPLGPFAFEKSLGALTLTEARAEANRLAELYRKPESRDVRAYLQRETQRVEDEKRAAEEAKRTTEQASEVRRQEAQRATMEAAQYTLMNLFAAYVDHLRKQCKLAAYDAENMFKNHVTESYPAIAAMPANTVTARDVVTLLRPLIEARKGRTAGKLRSYLRAAYALAARAEIDPDAPAVFLPFRVDGNPVAATGTLAKFNRALERALSEPELREYYGTLKDAPDSPIRDALLLGLMLGGQRTAQIVRASVADVDVTAKTLHLFDPKGRRSQARAHVLPLTDGALTIVERCLARAKEQESTWLFSTHGDAPLRPETVTNGATAIAAALRAKPDDERVIKAPFQLRDLRRTCETRLAGLGISKDIRAQIQSHGLGGIQGRHYDKHDYADEKRAALVAWAAYLEAVPASNVRHLRGRRMRRA